MKRLLVIITASILLAFTVTPVLALVSGPPTQDAWVGKADPGTVTNDVNLWVRASTVSCTPDRVTYLQWDLSNLTSSQIGYAALTMRVNGVTGDFSIPRNVTLYRLLDDNWTETNVTWNLVNPGETPGAGPNLGAAIQTIPVSGAGMITFDSANLLSYFKEKAGGKISFALEMTDNCTAGSTGVRFDSAEPSTGGSEPSLDLRTAGPPPNVVEVSTVSAQQNSSWPLYAGLGAVALFVVAGVVVSRRRTA